MTQLQCLALDDEPLALGLLAEYIQKTPFLHLVEKCDNAVDALGIIHTKDIDLIFSDIQMNGLSGLELARVLSGINPAQRPILIFTTAYEKYALEGYKVDALDYLLKPYSYEDFLRAATKAQTMKSTTSASTHSDDFIMFKVEYNYAKVKFDNIRYIEGLKDYVKVHLEDSNRPLLSLTSLKRLEEKLPSSNFMRVHRSFMVNLDKITLISRSSVSIGEDEIPVSESHREAIQQRFKNRIN